MKLIGIFGGTFDPLHTGHLRVAEEVREYYGLERVYFVPASNPPHKMGQRTLDAEDRLHIVQCAIRGNEHFRASGIEIRRGGVSYTIDTLKAFEKRYGSLYFLIGIDAFSELVTWHKYKELFSHTNFVVMVRPAQEYKPGIALFPAGVEKYIQQIDDCTFEHTSGNRIYFHQVTKLDISSTRIRDSLREGRSVKYLVPYSVERLIRKKRLYII